MSLEISGEQVREWRRHLRMSQAQLAAEIGKTRNTVNSWESDRGNPPKWLLTWFLGFKYGKQVARKPSKRPPPEIRDKVLAAYQAGEKTAWIAAEFKVDRQYPGKLAKRLGLPIRPPHGVKKSERINYVS